jgi:hypothetical protein
VSPKSNKSGVSYDENDPRSLSGTHPLNPQARGPVVTRARDFDAAVEGLNAPRPDDGDESRDEVNDSFVDDHELGGLEEVQYVEEETPVDYSAWTKVRLNEELDRREIEHDSKANNAALITLLEDDDARRADHGDGTPPQSS